MLLDDELFGNAYEVAGEIDQLTERFKNWSLTEKQEKIIPKAAPLKAASIDPPLAKAVPDNRSTTSNLRCDQMSATSNLHCGQTSTTSNLRCGQMSATSSEISTSHSKEIGKKEPEKKAQQNKQE